MSAQIPLNELIHQLSLDVARANSEMQLLQQAAWNDCISYNENSIDENSDEFFQLKANALNELKDQINLNLNEVKIQFEIEKVSWFKKMLINIMNPKTNNISDYRLVPIKNKSTPRNNVELIFRRNNNDSWQVITNGINEDQYEQTTVGKI